MLIGSCEYIHFWKWVVSNRVGSTDATCGVGSKEATCGCGWVSKVFVACWSAALCSEFRKFLLGALHLLAPPWLGYCPKVEKVRTLKHIKVSSANLSMDNYYATLLSWVLYFGTARKGTILVAVCLELRSSAARLMGLQVRIPSGTWICLLWMLCDMR